MASTVDSDIYIDEALADLQLEEDLLSANDPVEEEDEPEEVTESQAFINDLCTKIVLFCEEMADAPFFPYQREFGFRLVQSIVLNDGEEITALQARQSGKALALDTPMLTPDRGWVTMGDLNWGDWVFAPDGTATRITATSDVFTDHDCFKVRFQDGQEIVADADHRWTFYDAKAKREVTVTTRELAETGASYQNNGKSCWRYRVQTTAPVEFPEADLPIDPYLLGCWLGDGDSQGATVTTMDWEIAQAFYDVYEPGFVRAAGGRSVTYNFLGLFAPLKKMGLLTHHQRYPDGSKHIPEQYVMASPKQRLALLQGLMDTDGHCTKHGEVEFCSIKKQLAEDTLLLVRSLGWKATIRTGRATLNGKDCGEKYRVTWTPYQECNPFRLERKAERVKQRPVLDWRARRTETIALVAVEQVVTVPTKCIAVEHESHLYLAGSGLVPTHNTQVVSVTLAGCMVILPKLAQLPRYAKLLEKFRKGLMVGVFAPVEDQAATLWGRIVSWLSSDRAAEIMLDPDIDDKVARGGGAKCIVLKKSGSLCRQQTANPKAKIESKSYHVVVIDEAQEVDDYTLNKSIRPMMAFYNGTIVLTGTPSRTKGEFYRAIQRNKRRMTLRGAVQNHFEYNWRFVAKYNPNYAKFIKKEIQRLGSDSEEFLLSYELKWLLDRGMFVTEAVMAECGDKSMDTVKSWYQTPVLVGIDPARTVDSTVVTVVWVDWDHPDAYGYYEHRVLNWLEIMGDDWEDQYFQIIDFLAAYNVFAIAIDGTGVGDPFAERIAKLIPRAEVHAMKSSNQEQSTRWKHLTELIGRRMVGWPAHPKTRRTKKWMRFNQQMLDLEKHYQGPYLLAEAPDGDNSHDDFPDSLALACALTKDMVMPEVEESSSQFYDRSR